MLYRKARLDPLISRYACLAMRRWHLIIIIKKKKKTTTKTK